MDSTHQITEDAGPVRLAAEPSLWVGGMEVSPSTREVRWAEQVRTLEPRVMQVLIVLAQGEGSVVARDELFARCWDGRIVGDNSINRVISALRRLAADSGTFRLETVTKVGYRLLTTESGVGSPNRRPTLSRKSLIAAVVALATVTVGTGLWRHRQSSNALSPEAEAYLQDGRKALEAGRPQQDIQAVAYLRRATDLAPRSSEAWGALALALVTQIGDRGPAGLERDVAWVISAARRALELNPNNGEAQTALLQTRPVFRNWSIREPEFRAALARYPSLPPLLSAYADFLVEVGRWREAAVGLEKLVTAKPMTPAFRIQLATTLWGAQRLEDADRAFADAVRLFPAHGWAWTARFDFLMLNGHPAEAIASAADPLALPQGPSPMPVDLGLKVAGALQSRSSQEVDLAITATQAALAKGQLGIAKAIAFLSGLGALDQAFAVIQQSYFRPSQGLDLLQMPPSFVLFGAVTKPMRQDPRFADIVRRLGFETFWQKSGVQPDFRQLDL